MNARGPAGETSLSRSGAYQSGGAHPRFWLRFLPGFPRVKVAVRRRDPVRPAPPESRRSPRRIPYRTKPRPARRPRIRRSAFRQARFVCSNRLSTSHFMPFLLRPFTRSRISPPGGSGSRRRVWAHSRPLLLHSLLFLAPHPQRPGGQIQRRDIQIGQYQQAGEQPAGKAGHHPCRFSRPPPH